MWKTKPKLISIAGNSSLPKCSEINRDGYRIGRLKIHDLCIQQDSKHLEFCSINLDFVKQKWYLESLCSSDIVVDNMVVREDQTAILKCNSCIQLPEKIVFIFKCGVTNCQVCETECPEKTTNHIEKQRHDGVLFKK